MRSPSPRMRGGGWGERRSREAAAGMKAKSAEFKQKGGELYVKQG